MKPPRSALMDRYGRQVRDLRVSLTDRCNLRCSYCMPAEGLEWLPAEETLTDDEVVRLIKLAIDHFSITSVRFTGGEPLLRKGLADIASRIHSYAPTVNLAITTNALGLDKKAAALVQAGVSRANISLDSLNPLTYAQVARRDRLGDALAGIAAAQAAGMDPIKINTVVMRGVNDREPTKLLRFCLERGYQLRFIEQMPLGPKHQWDRQAMITQAEILQTLADEFDLTPVGAERGSSPAQQWLARDKRDGKEGSVGVIASVTAPFCGSCDRSRLTADGQLRNCLFATTETDLRTPLRGGATDTEIAQLWREGTWLKAAGHLIGDDDFQSPDRTMSRIGG